MMPDQDHLPLPSKPETPAMLAQALDQLRLAIAADPSLLARRAILLLHVEGFRCWLFDLDAARLQQLAELMVDPTLNNQAVMHWIRTQGVRCEISSFYRFRQRFNQAVVRLLIGSPKMPEIDRTALDGLLVRHRVRHQSGQR